jgi:hypothetical protein
MSEHLKIDEMWNQYKLEAYMMRQSIETLETRLDDLTAKVFALSIILGIGIVGILWR